MKTIREWYEIVGDDAIRAKLLANLYPSVANDVKPTFKEAVTSGFPWGHSLEGYEYWSNYLNDLDL